MGANLDVAIEIQNANGYWKCIAFSWLAWRGFHDENIHTAGHDGFPIDVEGETLEYADKSEEPYWRAWFDGQDFVTFAENNFGKVVPTDAVPEGYLFDAGDTLPALVAMVRHLVDAGHATRVVCWYGQ